MYSDHDLEAAIEAGVIDRPTVERFRRYVASLHDTPIVDEEHFRLLTGFNDIFVSIAIVLLLGALAWLGQSVPTGVAGLSRCMAGLMVAAASWGLAEFFTRQRRMALPSILLLLCFVAGLGETAFAGLHTALALRDALPLDRSTSAALAAAVAAVAAIGATAHWRRFHVPITVAAASAGAVGTGVALLTAAVPSLADHLAALTFTAGLAVFGFALRWDLADPRRETRRSDVAFWLHLLAAPLIIHSAFAAWGLLRGTIDMTDAALVVLIYLALGVVALTIDRRALMVSALVYVIYAMSALFRHVGALDTNIALTALIMGGALLVLSVFWSRLRGRILALLPASLQARLPPAAVAPPM